VVNGCSAFNNTANGIDVSFGSSVVHCGVYSNEGDGITASLACVVKDNSVYGNTADNIQVATDCLVMNNTSTSAGFNAGDGAGIHVTGGRNRIDGNNVTSSDRGIDVDQANNSIVNNTVRGNPFSGAPANYVISAGNQVNILLTHIPETIGIPATVTLGGDLTGVSGSAGLTITSDNVTVDLAGHALVGIAGTLDGIVISGSRKNIVIKNGSVRSWGGAGIDAAFSTNGQFDRLELTDNTGGSGLHAGDRSLVTDCTARSNTGNGIEAGIIATITRCIAAGNTGIGIKASETAMIERCNLNNNPSGGISVSNFSVVRDNNCDFHTTNSGIAVTGTDNRVEGNNLTRNARGIDVGAAGNLIIKNSATGSTGAGTPSANYDFNGFTQTNGAIVTATGTISADAWANFSY
jgi:parallel beta-helix repeat protein